ncbi:MAG: hypothetical protein VYC39_18585, partial [Myxococcota bacterium]|nr:hypothetical protein [Myxococcota bacterium]
MKLWTALGVFVLSFKLSITAAQASSVVVVVRDVGDKTHAVDISRLERTVVKTLALQYGQKVLNRSKAMESCLSSDCFSRRLGASPENTWFLIELELVRKGIFGLGSRCVVSVEERNKKGLRVGDRKQLSSSCKFEKLVVQTKKLLRRTFTSETESAPQYVSESGTSEQSKPLPKARKKFTACGKNRKEALELLSQTISSRVSDSFVSKESANEEDEKFEISKELSIQSDVHLLNIEWSQKGKEVCASQGYQELLSATIARLERVSECEKQMPDEPKLRQRVVSACLSDIRFVSEIYPVFWTDMSDSHRQIAKSLETQAARLEELGGKIFFQSIRIDA